jgi:lipoprotein-anchoring transpeptidase ErfK/SrfK
LAEQRGLALRLLIRTASHVMRATLGKIMAQIFEAAGQRKLGYRLYPIRVLAGALVIVSSALIAPVNAQTLGYASTTTASAFPPDDTALSSDDPANENVATDVVQERLRRTPVAINSNEAPGTIILDTGNTVLYYVTARGRAIRYGVGVGREGFTWSGAQTVTNKAEWPDWHPPAQMIARQPYLPRFMAGGPGNPLGARAMYLGTSDYRIHGTNDPTTIGKFVSSGCIRLTNEDVTDLFNRVRIGTKVVVLPKNGAHIAARPIDGSDLSYWSTSEPSRRRQALNISSSSMY